MPNHSETLGDNAVFSRSSKPRRRRLSTSAEGQYKWMRPSDSIQIIETRKDSGLVFRRKIGSSGEFAALMPANNQVAPCKDA
jgi:hypothetical protein